MSEQTLCDPGCEICGGTGYFRLDLPVDHPQYGKLHPCPGWYDASKHADLSWVGISQEDLGRSWEDFKIAGNLRAVLDRVRAVLDRGYGMIYLWGEFGTGKTSILKTAVSWWIQNRTRLCSYITMADLVEYIRRAYDEEHSSSEKQRRLNKYTDMDLLCVDELDRLRSTEFMEETQFSVLDRRYQRSLSKLGVTILVSNKAPSSLDGYLKSRIQDSRHEVLQILLEDVRPYQMWEDKFNGD